MYRYNTRLLEQIIERITPNNTVELGSGGGPTAAALYSVSYTNLSGLEYSHIAAIAAEGYNRQLNVHAVTSYKIIYT